MAQVCFHFAAREGELFALMPRWKCYDPINSSALLLAVCVFIPSLHCDVFLIRFTGQKVGPNVKQKRTAAALPCKKGGRPSGVTATRQVKTTVWHQQDSTPICCVWSLLNYNNFQGEVLSLKVQWYCAPSLDCEIIPALHCFNLPCAQELWLNLVRRLSGTSGRHAQ